MSATRRCTASKPARLFDRLTDPKLAKRLVTVGTIVTPAIAPFVLRSAARLRGMLDAQRARRLGVPVADVAVYRGPTGPAGARIDGLSDAIAELGSRKGADLQITRFVDVASARLEDLTTAVQAAASMPPSQRRQVLATINRQLDEISADLTAHLLTPVR